MTVDRYTRGVLTVIAACLLWLCALCAPGSVLAQQTSRQTGPWSQQVQPVVIVGIGDMDADGAVTVRFPITRGRKQWTDPTVPVHLPYTPANPLPAQLGYTSASPLPVEINGVKKTTEWEPIRTKVEPEPGRAKPGGH